jgi:hypothetical protein
VRGLDLRQKLGRRCLLLLAPGNPVVLDGREVARRLGKVEEGEAAPIYVGELSGLLYGRSGFPGLPRSKLLGGDARLLRSDLHVETSLLPCPQEECGFDECVDAESHGAFARVIHERTPTGRRR